MVQVTYVRNDLLVDNFTLTVHEPYSVKYDDELQLPRGHYNISEFAQMEHSSPYAHLLDFDKMCVFKLLCKAFI